MSCQIQNPLQPQHAKNIQTSRPAQSTKQWSACHMFTFRSKPFKVGFQHGLAIGMVKCIVVGNLHKVSNVWRGPGKFLQSIHSDVDHIILIWERTLAENLLDFKKKHFRPAYLLPCLTSQWLATTLVGCSCLGAWFLSEIFLIRKHLYSLAPTPVSLFVRSFVIVFD